MTITAAAPTSAEFRRRFPIFERKTYLSSCSQGALSREVRDAFATYLESWDEAGNPWDAWVAEMERLRTRFATLINAADDEVAISFSASTAINSLVSGLGFDEHPRVVSTELDFPTVGHILLANRTRGAEVRFAPARGGRVAADEVAGLIDERTRLVAVSHVSYRTGAMLDLRPVVEAARKADAVVLLDAYQSAGTTRIDVEEMGIDVLVTGALKYLLGPPGVGFMYVRRERIADLLPVDTGWFAQRDPFAFDVQTLDYAPSANRFQSGSPPVPAVYGALAGLDLVEEVGLDRAEAHIRDLTGRLITGAHELGLAVSTPAAPAAHGPLVVIESADVATLLERLGQEGFVCSSRGTGLRVSLHYYNVEEDVDHLLEALGRHQDLIERRGDGG